MTASLILAYAALTAMMFIAMPDLIAFARDMQEQIQNNPNYFYEGSPLFFPTSISIASGVFSLLSAAAAVLFGMFGNHLYWKFVKRRLRPAGETIPDHPAQRDARQQSGRRQNFVSVSCLGIKLCRIHRSCNADDAGVDDSDSRPVLVRLKTARYSLFGRLVYDFLCRAGLPCLPSSFY